MTQDQAKILILHPPAGIEKEQSDLIKDIAAAVLSAVVTAGWSKKLFWLLLWKIGKAVWPYAVKLVSLHKRHAPSYGIEDRKL